MAVGPLRAPALALGGAVFGGATSAAAASGQNRAIKRSMQSRADAAKAQQRQLGVAAGVEKQKRINEAQAIEGRIRVAAADAGVSTDGSYSQLLAQNDYDAAASRAITDANYRANIDYTNSGLAADFASLRASARNPILDGFVGGLSGAQAGLSLGNSIEDYVNSSDTLNKPLPDSAKDRYG